MGEDAVHMPTGITNVTGKQRDFNTPGTVYHQRGLAGEEMRDDTGPGEAEGWCLKSEIGVSR